MRKLFNFLVLSSGLLLMATPSVAQVKRSELSSLNRADEDKAYQNHGSMAAWFCTYDMKSSNRGKALKDFAYEVDQESIYFKRNGQLMRFVAKKSNNNDKKYHYAAGKHQLTVSVLKESNCTEYNEACDRDVKFTFKEGKSAEEVLAKGLSCGI